jgi:ketosteroid isomerase-like protein
MHPNEELIHTFYGCLARRDGAGMAACYHPEVVFSDPAFARLSGAQAGAMWRMLCERGHDLAVRHTAVVADDQRGSAHWEATYTFSKTGRQVLNIIDAAFEFKDGKIVRHTDSFNFWRWAGQALGPVGKLFGWAPPLKRAVGKEAMRGLDAWMAKNKIA